MILKKKKKNNNNQGVFLELLVAANDIRSDVIMCKSYFQCIFNKYDYFPR